MKDLQHGNSSEDSQNASQETSQKNIRPEYEDTVFSKIIRQEIPSYKVYEDEYTYAFLDIHPAAPGHTLVVPKEAYENIYTLPPELWARLMLSVQKVALAVKHATNADGINIMMNNESAAGQDVFHAHVHIIPRMSYDGIKHDLKRNEINPKEAVELITTITKSL